MNFPSMKSLDKNKVTKNFGFVENTELMDEDKINPCCK